MNITYREFIHSLLLGARMLDECRPYLNTEEIVWASWCFDDAGVHYIPPIERTNLIIERAEERFYETGKWPLQ